MLSIKQVLTITGWGPIYDRDVRIEIKPLTIFIGENNSGKSFIALTYYALANKVLDIVKFLSDKKTIKYIESNDRVYSLILEYIKRNSTLNTIIQRVIVENKLGKVRDEIVNILTSNIEELITNFSTEILNSILRDHFPSGSIAEYVEYVFGSTISNLVNFKRKSFSIELNVSVNDRINIFIGISRKSGRVSVRENIRIEFTKIFIKDIKRKYRKLISKKVNNVIDTVIKTSILWEGLSREIEKRRELIVMTIAYSLRDLLVYIADKVRSELDGFYERINYLPASRSGILLSYRNLLATILSLTTPLFDVKLSKLPGYIIDFLRNISITEKTRGNELSKIFEEHIIDGRIFVEKIDSIPEIYYMDRFGNKIPINMISSLISELAPIDILTQRGMIGDRSITIIEEPESHLHPYIQVLLTCFLVRILNRYRSTILITTHSDIILYKISNIISQSVANVKESRYSICSGVKLDINEISVYIFRRKPSGDTKVEKISVSPYGIPDEEFRRIYEALYDEYMNIYYKLQSILK